MRFPWQGFILPDCGGVTASLSRHQVVVEDDRLS
jgi:hypothetical protein